MTAIDAWIAELDQNRFSINAQPLTSTVDTAVGALMLINTSGSFTPQAANTFFAGPPSAGPALPTFRVPVTADFPVTLSLSIANINFNGAAAPANGFRLSGANTMRATANSADIFQWSASGIVMVAGSITPLSTNGIVGTTTNDNAAAGSDGEFIESVVTVASPVTYTTTGTPQNLTSISLTAGDWDVQGVVGVNPGGTLSALTAGFNTVTGVLPAQERQAMLTTVAGFSGGRTCVTVPRTRFSLTTTTTVFFVVNATFSTTATMAGFFNARRVR